MQQMNCITYKHRQATLRQEQEEVVIARAIRLAEWVNERGFSIPMNLDRAKRSIKTETRDIDSVLHGGDAERLMSVFTAAYKKRFRELKPREIIDFGEEKTLSRDDEPTTAQRMTSCYHPSSSACVFSCDGYGRNKYRK